MSTCFDAVLDIAPSLCIQHIYEMKRLTCSEQAIQSFRPSVRECVYVCKCQHAQLRPINTAIDFLGLGESIKSWMQCQTRPGCQMDKCTDTSLMGPKTRRERERERES
jgi:hypothetical protein